MPFRSSSREQRYQAVTEALSPLGFSLSRTPPEALSAFLPWSLPPVQRCIFGGWALRSGVLVGVFEYEFNATRAGRVWQGEQLVWLARGDAFSGAVTFAPRPRWWQAAPWVWNDAPRVSLSPAAVARRWCAFARSSEDASRALSPRAAAWLGEHSLAAQLAFLPGLLALAPRDTLDAASVLSWLERFASLVGALVPASPALR